MRKKGISEHHDYGVLIKEEHKKAKEETHYHEKKGVKAQGKDGENAIRSGECGCYSGESNK